MESGVRDVESRGNAPSPEKGKLQGKTVNYFIHFLGGGWYSLFDPPQGVLCSVLPFEGDKYLHEIHSYFFQQPHEGSKARNEFLRY
jgi:hypothetical protein